MDYLLYVNLKKKIFYTYIDNRVHNIPIYD